MLKFRKKGVMIMPTENHSNKVNSHYDNAYKTIQKARLGGVLVNYFHRKIEKEAANLKTKKILEVGVGKWEHFSYVVGPFQEYVGLDIASPPQVLPLSSDGSNVRHVQGSVEEIPFPDEYFDRVFCTCLLHHVGDLSITLSEMRRVVSAGGFVEFFVPCDPGLVYRILRFISTRNTATKLGLSDYDLIHALEHRNHFWSIDRLVKDTFKSDNFVVTYFPFRLKLWNINAFVIYRIFKK